MPYHQEFGIDLGTDTIKIYDKKEGSVTIEKNFIAVRNQNDVLAVGNEAYAMLNRSAADTVVTTPVEAGRIRDVWLTEAILHSLLFRQGHYVGYRPSIYFAVPTDMTEIERRAYASIARRGKLRNCSVYLVEKPIADALALGIPIGKARGSMMINMGSYSTTLSAIAESRVILNSTVPIGGIHFDEAVMASVRRKNRLIISIKTAEELKKLFMSSDSSPMGVTVDGIDADTGLPRNGFVTASSVARSVMSSVEEMTEELLRFLERTPPQIRDTIAREGIHIVGGSSRIIGISDLLCKRLNYPVVMSSLYENSAINGLKEVITYSGANKLAYSPGKVK